MAGLAGWVQDKFNKLRPEDQQIDTSGMRTAAQVVRDGVGYVHQSVPTVTQNAGYSTGDRSGAIVYGRNSDPVQVENPDTGMPVSVTPVSGGGGGQPAPMPTEASPFDYQPVPSGADGFTPYSDGGEREAMERALSGNRDADIQGQEAALRLAMENEISGLQAAYQQAVQDGELSVREADAEFEANVKIIQQKAYEDSKNLLSQATELGINNSNQRMGMEYSAQADTNSLLNKNVTTRELKISSIKDRLASIKAEKDLLSTQAQSKFDYGMATATADANKQYNQNMFTLANEDFNFNRELQGKFQLMDKEQQYNVSNLNLKFQQELEAMSVQHGYAQALQSSAIAGQMRVLTAQAAMEVEAEAQRYAVNLARESATLRDPDSDEYKNYVAAAKIERQNQLMSGVTEGLAGYAAELAVQRQSGKQLIKPIDFKSDFVRYIADTDRKQREFDYAKGIYEQTDSYLNDPAYANNSVHTKPDIISTDNPVRGAYRRWVEQ